MDQSLISKTRFHHIHHRQLVILPHSVNDRIVLVENALAVEFVLLEGAFISLSVLEVLGAFAIEHAVVPVPFVLFVSALTVENAPSALHSVSELSFVPASITPPEGTAAIAFACLELALIDVAFLASPVINASAFLLIEPELAQVKISSGEVQFSLAFELSVVEVSVDDLVGALEEADSLAVGSVDLRLPDVDNLRILEELWVVESRLNSQHNRRAIFDSQKFLQSQLDDPQLSPNESRLITEIIEVKLSLLQHLLLRTLINLQLAAHPPNQQPQSLVHLIDGLEPACFYLLQRILSKQDGLFLSMQFILLGDVALYNC